MTDDDDLRAEVRRLREEVDALQRRLDAVESAVDADGDPDPAADPPASADEPPGGPEPAGDDRTAPGSPREGPTADAAGGEPAAAAEPAGPEDRPAAAQPATEDAPDPADGRDWESAVGVRWLGLAGALALVVGVVFFVRLAIERGLLGPAGRVAVGTLGGLVLFGGGRYAAGRQGFLRWGRIAAGAGLAVAYFSVYAAYGFETYRDAIGTPLWAVLAALTLLVAATAAVSVRDGAPLVAGEAFLLGYATAVLSTEAATVVVTPVYTLLLAAAVVAIATVKPWRGLATASALATYAVVGLWVLVVDPARAGVAAVAAAAFATYLGGSYALHADDGVGRVRRALLVTLTLSNALAGGVLLEGSLQDAFPEAGLAGLGLAAVAAGLGALYAATARRGARRDHAAAVAAVLFAAAAVRVAAGVFPTTVGWVVLLVVAVAVARRAGAPAVRMGGHGLAAALVAKLLVVDATALSGFDAGDPVAALTGRPAAFLLGVVALYGLAWHLDAVEPSLTDHERHSRVSVDAPYAVAGTVLVLALFALELSGVGASVAWALFGLVLLGVGFAVDRRGVRALGVGVLGVTTAKVFLYDTSDLDTVARTVSFLVVGAILLAASYVYARSRGDEGAGIELPGRN